MARNINAKVHGTLHIADDKVTEIFETGAKPSGNGAVIYVPKKYLKNKFYVVVCS